MQVVGATVNVGTFRGCGVRGVGTASGAGIIVGTGGQTLVEGGFAYLTNVGLTIYSFQGGGTTSLVGGNYSQNGSYGIYFTADNYYTPCLNMSGVTANYNGSYGLYITAGAFSFVPNQEFQGGTTFCIAGCSFIGNTGIAQEQVCVNYVGTTGGYDWLIASIQGCVLRTSASQADPGKLRVIGSITTSGFLSLFKGLRNSAGTITSGSALVDNSAILSLV